MRPIALLNPLGDYGINQYCHELAEGLGANGASVAFYTGSDRGLPPNRLYERFAVLNSTLLKQRAALRDGRRASNCSEELASPEWSKSALEIPALRAAAVFHAKSNLARRWFLTAELALHLKTRGFGAIWTHWPELESYHSGFWGLCRRLGLFVVHTAHNVAPHDSDTAKGDAAVYEAAHMLVVHSAFARDELLQAWPQLADKVAIAPHGLYTMYPRRPESRERVRRDLRVAPHQPMVLFCGAVRPYKNIDATLEALRDDRCRNAVLVVAGTERGFPDLDEDPLGRTRRLARQWGMEDRVRLIPRHLSIGEMAELFEAGDIKILPYLKGYGSGMLLLAMTFGKYVAATRTGGAEEYLENYPRATLLKGSDSSSVADGLAEAIARYGDASAPGPMTELEWRNIARLALDLLGASRTAPGKRLSAAWGSG